jgi:hypothetical protein
MKKNPYLILVALLMGLLLFGNSIASAWSLTPVDELVRRVRTSKRGKKTESIFEESLFN